MRMKKRVYRAVSLGKVNREELLEKVRGTRVVFGIDAAKEDFFGALLNEDKEVIQTIKWKSPHEARDLVSFLEALTANNIEVAMEPTGTYGDACRALLEQAGYRVFLVNPKRSSDAVEWYDGVPSSHDAKSAAIIGDLHLSGRSSLWREKSEEERALAAAVEIMKIHDADLQKNLNRLEAKLARYWPELSAKLALGSATLLGLLEQYGGPDGVARNPRDAIAAMRRIGRTMMSPDKCEAVVASAANTIGVPMTDAEREALQILAAVANRARVEAKAARQKVERLAESSPQLSGLAAAVGKATAAALTVELGYATDYSCAAAYRKAAGLNLKERSSGKHKGAVKITKRGPGEVRFYLYMLVLRLIQRDAVCGAWYEKKVARDGGRYKGRAIVALMRKVIKALWYVGQGQAFDSSKLFNVNRLGLAA